MAETSAPLPQTAVPEAGRIARLRRWGNVRPQAGLDPGEGAATVFTAQQRCWLLAGFALLTMLRLPLAWVHGRFMGEEGTVFLAYAWHRPAGEALWRSFAGYLNLGANASTLAAARLVRDGLPLELAPRFTMAVALAFQVVPAALILTGRGQWLANRWAVIACLLIIAMSPMTEEVFANILHIQFHLALACALILALDVPVSRRAQAIYGLPLLLGPLCGPGAIVLAPLFALRTLVDRSPGRLVQTAVLAAASAVQMLMFYTPNPMRGHLVDPASLTNIMFVRLAAMPYISGPLAKLLGHGEYWLYGVGGIGWSAATAVAVAYFGWLVIEALRNRRGPGLWLVLSGLMLAAISFGAGMLQVDPSQWFNVGAAERYNFLPATLLGMGLVALARRPENAGRRLFPVLCSLLLVSGLVTFFAPIKDMRRGADWRAEVALWHADHGHMLVTWPLKWTVDLSDQDRACRPPVPGSMVSQDPTYCESNWQALVMRDSKRKSWVKQR